MIVIVTIFIIHNYDTILFTLFSLLKAITILSVFYGVEKSANYSW